ncbi:TonB-dependent receptor domain-containing protein [Pontibacter sp. CAU 1760]
MLQIIRVYRREIARIISHATYTILLCCCSAFICPAQTLISIHGTAIDSTTQTPLSYVTVVVQETDSNYPIKTTLTLADGTFAITGLPASNYRLTLSYVGYKTTTLKLPPPTTAAVDLGIIQLAPTAMQLQEVQVTTQKPLIEQDVDKLTYNVTADPDHNLLNTLEMLRKVPQLTTNADDNLQLNGSSNYQILVNGKRSALLSGNPSEVLKSLPASALKKIEVITTPSSRYAAEGATGIINIVTHSKSIRGYHGAANLGGSSPEGYSASTYANTAVGKFSTSGRISSSSSKSPPGKSSSIREDLNKQGRLVQTGISENNRKAWGISSELAYAWRPQDLITVGYSMNRNSSASEFMQAVARRDGLKELTEAYQNQSENHNNSNGHDITLDYQHSLDEAEAHTLAVSFNLTNSNYENASGFTLVPVLNYEGRESVTTSHDNTELYALQVDYTRPLGAQALEAGIKSTVENNSSSYYYKNQNPETYTFDLDSSLSNSFSYQQQLHAAYTSVSLQQDKWGLRVGARLEGTKLDARFKSSATRARQGYLHLFPSITLSRLLQESSSIKLSYTQRIDRPSLYLLNPYVDLIDPVNISYGNPSLRPATTHTLRLDYMVYTKGTAISIGLFHHFTNSAIQSFTTLGTDAIARTTFGNIGENQTLGLSLNGNKTFFQKLSANLDAGFNYVKFISAEQSSPQGNEGFTYNVRGATTYRFGKGWRASGNLSYNSPNVMLQGRASGYTWSSMSLHKEFLKNNRASLSLSVRSPLQRYRRTSSQIHTPNFHQQQAFYTVVRQVSLAFNYRFGKLQGR